LFLILALAIFDFIGVALIYLSIGDQGSLWRNTRRLSPSANDELPAYGVAEGGKPDTARSLHPQVESSPAEPHQAEKIDAIVAAMSLRELIGQRFVIYVPGRSVDDWLQKRIRRGHPGGFILYPHNYSTPEDVRRLTDELRRLTMESTHGIAPIISADQEGGRVAALRFDSFVQLPSAFDIGSFRDSDFAQAAGYITGEQLQEVGVNMNLAPVVDVYGGNDSTIIGDRAFSGDTGVTATMGTAFMRGLNRAGVMAVAKHFPGHGVSTTDSHGALPVSNIAPEELWDVHIRPFAEMIRAGVEVVMPAHVLYSRIDASLPATLSPTIMRDVLRQRLGFDGVVIADGLEMGALTNNFSKREILARTLTNGTDLLLLISDWDLLEMARIAEDLVDEGVVSRAHLRASVRRILELKARYGLLSDVRVDELTRAVAFKSR
jgi:beta-N-acetylhexosaminidase